QRSSVVLERANTVTHGRRKRWWHGRPLLLRQREQKPLLYDVDPDPFSYCEQGSGSFSGGPRKWKVHSPLSPAPWTTRSRVRARPAGPPRVWPQTATARARRSPRSTG